MPILINIRQLQKQNLQLAGELVPLELNLNGLDECIEVSLPIRYQLEAEMMDSQVLVRGCITLQLELTCVRCLKQFSQPCDFTDWACDLALEGEDKTPVANDCVDLTPQIREDILLAFPQHPLCETGCGGLKRLSGAAVDRRIGPEPGGVVPTAWAELDKLKLNH
jgi:uncharacterized protein